MSSLTIYTDGVWDLLHVGHLKLLEQARGVGARLVVGVMSDDRMEADKRRPIMSLAERASALEHVRWVDKVIPDAPDPSGIDATFLEEHGIDLVVHAFPEGELWKIQAEYAHLISIGKFKELQRTAGINTSDLIARCQAARAVVAAVVAPDDALEVQGRLNTPQDISDFVKLREHEPKSYATRYGLNIISAKDHLVRASNGKQYIDCLNGFGVHVFGHNADFLHGAVRNFMQRSAIWQCLDLATPERTAFIEEVFSVLPPTLARHKIAFAGCSGSEAVEQTIQLARRHTSRDCVFAFSGCYHGNTHLTSTLTGNQGVPHGVRSPNIHHFPFPRSSPAACPFGIGGSESSRACMQYLRAAIQSPKSGYQVPAAIIVEPVQSDGGVIAAPAAFLRDLARLCQEHRILLICDEVQTGCGKLGTWLGCERAGPDFAPDIVCCSKAWGGGFPVSFCLYSPELCGLPHSGTFRGNQIAFVAGAACIREMKARGLLSHVRSMEAFWRARSAVVLARHDAVAECRAEGSLFAVELKTPQLARAAFDRLLANGVLCKLGGCHDRTLIFWMGLCVPLSVCDEVCSRVDEALRI